MRGRGRGEKWEKATGEKQTRRGKWGELQKKEDAETLELALGCLKEANEGKLKGGGSWACREPGAGGPRSKMGGQQQGRKKAQGGVRKGKKFRAVHEKEVYKKERR